MKIRKSDVYEEIRSIANNTREGSFVNECEFDFLMSHFVFHPWWNEKCPDGLFVVAISVGKRYEYDKHTCFFIHLNNGKIDDISAKKCVDAEFSRNGKIIERETIKDILKACRSAIKPIVNKMRYEICENLPMTFKSGVSGKTFTVKTRDDFHIDHYDMDFVDVVNAWMESHPEIKNDAYSYIVDSNDFKNTNGVEFASKELKDDFIAFHNANTHLRILPPVENIGRVKKQVWRPRMNITKTEALAALDALAKTGAYNAEKVDYAIRYVSAFGIVPEWLMSYKPGKWYVRHDGFTQETSAKSERDAINNVRYRLYDETPESALPPFVAICPFDIVANAARAVRINEGREDVEKRTTTDLFGRHTISKNEAIERIKRMMRKGK